MFSMVAELMDDSSFEFRAKVIPLFGQNQVVEGRVGRDIDYVLLPKVVSSIVAVVCQAM